MFEDRDAFSFLKNEKLKLKDLRIRSASTRLENFHFPSEEESQELDFSDPSEEKSEKSEKSEEKDNKNDQDEDDNLINYINNINEVANSMISEKEMANNGEFKMRDDFLDFNSNEEDIMKIRYVKRKPRRRDKYKSKQYLSRAKVMPPNHRKSLMPGKSPQTNLWAFKSNKEFTQKDEIYSNRNVKTSIHKEDEDKNENMKINIRQTGEIMVDDELYMSTRKNTMHWDSSGYGNAFGDGKKYQRFDSSEVDLLPGFSQEQSFKKSKKKKGDSGQSLDFLN